MAIKKNTNDLISQAATTLADNSTQDISPQDVREMAENNAFSSYNKITDNNLVGLKNYSTAATYEAAQGVVYNGSIYISNTIPTPGAFNASEWDILSGGEINTSSNSGAGEGLALAKSGSNLPFKSLTAGTGITLTSAANELQISSDSGEVNTSSNSGAGEGLALAKSGSNLPFKSITAGTGITLTSAANELQISSAGGADTNIANTELTLPSYRKFNLGDFVFDVRPDGTNKRFEFLRSGNNPVLDFFDAFSTKVISLGRDSAGNAGNYFYVNNKLEVGTSNAIKLQNAGGNGSYLKFSNGFNDPYTQIGALIPHYFLAASGALNTNKFLVGLSSAIGSEKIGFYNDTLIKGSDNAAATSGLKVTDVNNLSLLDVKNNGALKLQYLPSLPAGTVAGDVWSQNGTLRIGNPTANIQTEVSASTITPNIDTTKLIVTSALAAALTIAAPTGTPQEGQELTFRFKDDGTARALTWNAIFEDYTGSLPTTTTAGKTVYIGCKYNLINTKWDVVAVQTQP